MLNLSDFINIAIESKDLIINDKNVYVSPRGKFLFSTLVVLICFMIYLMVWPLFHIFSKTYRGFSKKTQIILLTSVVRSIYASIGGIGGIATRHYCFSNESDLFKSTSITSFMLILGHTGFFAFECLMQIYIDIKSKKLSKELHLHHVMAFLLYFQCVYYDTNHNLGCLSFVLETISPFSTFGWWLNLSNKQHTRTWRVNQYLLVHLFHLRNVVELLSIYELVKYHDFSKPLFTFLFPLFSFLTFTIYLTPYWKFQKTKALAESKNNSKID